MAQRFFLINDACTIGLYYQEEICKLTIGGNKKFHDFMIVVMEEYFKIKKYETIYPVKNKVKLTYVIGNEKVFFDGIKKLKVDGVILQYAKTFNRIWW